MSAERQSRINAPGLLALGPCYADASTCIVLPSDSLRGGALRGGMNQVTVERGIFVEDEAGCERGRRRVLP